MQLSALWISLLWSLTGALLGRAFLPVAERLSGARQRETSVPLAIVGPVERIAVRPTAAGRAAAVSVVVTAALFGLLAWRLSFGAELLAYSALALIGVPLAMIDLAELRLPTALVLPLYPTTVGFLGLAAVIDGAYASMLRATIGMVILPAAYLATALVTRGGIGGGDIRLAGPVGFVLAWESWTAVIIGTVLAFIYANIAILARIANGGANRHTPVPFGPAMLGGMFTAVIIPWTV
jgi:leader peptidase (prepilin peptidase)/N-methyltransferase